MRDPSTSIRTFSGVTFYPLDPRPEEILIEDIAHALSMICRFTGHVKVFYSVGDHSIRVSNLCHPEDKLHALLHDASEAYLSDISRPIKYTEQMSGYRAIEKNLQRCIYKKFMLNETEPPGVKEADRRMLIVEQREFLEGLSHRENEPLSQQEAEIAFVTNFNRLDRDRALRACFV